MPLKDDDVVRVLKALAHPTRYRMVQEIAAGEEMSCGEVGARFGLAQPTISHHVKLLSDAGILLTRFEGKHHFVSVDRKLLTEVGLLLPGRLCPTGKPKRSARAPKRGRVSRAPKRGRVSASTR